jgi:hypothetical protein
VTLEARTALLLWVLVAGLIAVLLVNAGKRPYLDFFYQHAPLWIYISAGWMRMFGDTWRSVHALSALLTGGCVAMVGGYVFSRCRGSSWRLATAASAALLTGLSYIVVWYGTIAQAYGLSLVLTFAAFRLVVGAVDRPRPGHALLAGICAGAAAAALLLTALVPIILWFWQVRHTDPKSRIRIGGAFLAGALLPFFPLVWLAVQAPRQVLFNVLEYHLFYRATWADRSWTLLMSLRTLTSWLSSVQALLLVLLAAITLTVLMSSPEWDQRQRRELRLCAWLAAGLALFLATTMPPFTHYFIFAVPFLSVLASQGIQVLGSPLALRSSLSRVTAYCPALCSGSGKAGLSPWPLHVGGPREPGQ